MFQIYKALHKPTGKFYIGYTSQKLEIRIGQHWGVTENKQKTFHKFLHTTEMNEWDWTILHVVSTYEEARDCEMHYIKTLNAYEVGLNESTGLGASTLANRQAASERLKILRKENPEPWNKGRKGVSAETRALMSMAKLRNPIRLNYTPELKLKKSLAASNSKKIMELKSGNIFHSISSAAREMGLTRELVRDVVNGKRNHTAGFVFKDITGLSEEEIQALRAEENKPE